jgi:hypothetical protein
MSLCGHLEQLELQEESVWIIHVCEERCLKPSGTHPTGIPGVDGGQPTYLTRVSGNSNGSSESSSFLFCGNYVSYYWKQTYEKLGNCDIRRL